MGSSLESLAIDSKSRCATLSRQEDATDMEEEWTFEHTIECAVSSEFAWDFWRMSGTGYSMPT